MSSIRSPFLSEIKECKLSMRKLRKKISKQCGSKQKKDKLKDSSSEIMGILNSRKIPGFITEALQKRRNFDLNSVKNIAINMALPLEQIRNRVNIQEQQIQLLYSDHRKRMEEEKRKAAETKEAKLALYQFSQSQIYSSTNEDEGIESLLDQSQESESIQVSVEVEEPVYENYFQNLEEELKEPIFTQNYLQMNESSVNSELDLFNF